MLSLHSPWSRCVGMLLLLCLRGSRISRLASRRGSDADIKEDICGMKRFTSIYARKDWPRTSDGIKEVV
jgi:hypothetical protein